MDALLSTASTKEEKSKKQEMKAIWKFPLGDDKKVVFKMPKGAKILSVQEQFREGVIWAIVNPMAELEDRYFESILTGWEFEFNGLEKYIGTYQTDAGNYVVHVFETFNKP